MRLSGAFPTKYGPHILSLWLSVACSDFKPNDKDLSGRWVQVFPTQGALETMELGADGVLSGAVTGLDSSGIPRTHWKVGHPLLPEGFCVGTVSRTNQRGRWQCVSYRKSGDTLWLANVKATTYLRARRVGNPSKAWDSPRRAVRADRPGGAPP